MAVYTEVAAEDLDVLLERYEIGGLAALKGIAGGVENSNFFLETDRGQFILTLYEKRVRRTICPSSLGSWIISRQEASFVPRRCMIAKVARCKLWQAGQRLLLPF
jgi:hypothetical protein